MHRFSETEHIQQLASLNHYSRAGGLIMWSLISRPTHLSQDPSQRWDAASLGPQTPPSRTATERWTLEDSDSSRWQPQRRRWAPGSRCKNSLRAWWSVRWVEPRPWSKPSPFSLSARSAGSPRNTSHSRLGPPRTSRLGTDARQTREYNDNLELMRSVTET